MTVGGDERGLRLTLMQELLEATLQRIEDDREHRRQNTGSMKSSVSHRNAMVTAARKMKNQARSIRRCSIVLEGYRC
jgi:hypothetical protein